jgi:hypothetical protein
MPTAIFHTTISLDGFTSGPGGAMDWLFVEGRPLASSRRSHRSGGSFLAGRRSWDPNPALDADERTAKPYGDRWSGPIVVLTHRPEEEPDDPTPSSPATSKPRWTWSLRKRRGRTSCSSVRR